MPEHPVSLWPSPAALGPVTDLYQLTMMAGYHASGLENSRATFELFVRRLPEHRSFLIFAGLEQAIGDIVRLAFAPEQIAAIRALPAFAAFDPRWFDGLSGLRFSGDIWAMPEGTVVFEGEPLVRVEAPLPQAQWIETYLIASLAYPTLVASKAARVVEAAAGRPCFDFGARRGHGPHAGMLCARASYLAGFSGTSLVEAGLRLGIPIVGTMAHSWVQAFGDEPAAFEAFSRAFPGSTLLVDTYDTPAGVRHAAAVEPPPSAIRLDSGDLGTLALQARAILDEAGRRGVKVFASGDLDEWKIHDLVASGVPIDGFGVGTELITSRDAPALAMVYKLVALDGAGRVKLSPGKRTYPLGKQVRRLADGQGRFLGDHVTAADEESPGEALLIPVVRDGRPVGTWPELGAIRERCRTQLAALPPTLLGPDARAGFPLSYSDRLQREAERLGLH